MSGAGRSETSAATIGAQRFDKPQTGDEYLESLRDGREVYVYGERVKDVTTHPAFRNTARMTARLFDALHDPEKSHQTDRPVIKAPTGPSSGSLNSAGSGFPVRKGINYLIKAHGHVGP